MVMDILNRHRLDEKVGFTCEATWVSDRFPCRDCSPEQCRISQPTPDLAVAFQADSLLPDNEFSIAWTRLKSLESAIFPEGTKEYQEDWAFHFFSMEAKGKRGTPDNKVALAQNLNTASQALFNIYRCMKEAGDLETFFKEVRVFSAVATAEGFWLRVHRPVQVNDLQHNKKEYPIGFMFDEVINLREQYTKSRVSGIVYNVLCRYGIEVLHPILKKTFKSLLERTSKLGSQLSEENLNPDPTGPSSLAALNLAPGSETGPASRTAPKRKRGARSGAGSSSARPKKRTGKANSKA